MRLSYWIANFGKLQTYSAWLAAIFAFGRQMTASGPWPMETFVFAIIAGFWTLVSTFCLSEIAMDLTVSVILANQKRQMVRQRRRTGIEPLPVDPPRGTGNEAVAA